MTQSTIEAAIRHGACRLTRVAGNPRLEARMLLAHALGVGQTDLVREPSRQVDTKGYEQLLSRREAHEPVAFLTGRREFWSMEFQVSNASIVPRPETETLIEAALDIHATRPPPARVLDLGSGTGCLLLALLREFPDAFGIGVDINPNAASLGRGNAANLGMSERAGFVCGDWTDAIGTAFDLIVANPPYVASAELKELMEDVARYEPRVALEAGPDGCDAYRALIPRLPILMSKTSAAIIELGAGQSDLVRHLAETAGFHVSFRTDLGGVDRAAVLAIDKARLSDLDGC